MKELSAQLPIGSEGNSGNFEPVRRARERKVCNIFRHLHNPLMRIANVRDVCNGITINHKALFALLSFLFPIVHAVDEELG